MNRTNRLQGFSLVEMLIAMSILAIVLSIVANGIVGTLKAQNINEELSTAQTKLRRITEVVSQDLRSAVLGGITSSPYLSDNDSISFSLLAGGAGYEVLPAADFDSAKSTTIIAPVPNKEALGLDGQQVMLVNSNGDASVFRVGTVTGGTNSQFALPHATCSNAIAYTPSTLLFGVNTLGYRFDSGTGTLFQTFGGGAEIPVAFDLTRFEISYIYISTTDGSNIVRRTTPLLDSNNLPLKQGSISGTAMELERLELLVATSRKLYTSQIDLSSNASFFVRKVASC